MSGNGTAARQYIYVLWYVFPMPWLWKIGITGNMQARLREINKTTFGVIVPIWFCKIYGAYYVEQFLLGILYPLKWHVNGSGGTEYRILGIIALPLILLAWAIDKLFLFLLTLTIVWIISDCPDEPINSLVRLLGRLFQSFS